MRFAIVTNIPSPYRVYFFNEIFKKVGEEFCVYYCSKSESNRNWIVNDLNHPHVFLKTRRLRKTIYWYSNVWNHLNIFDPDVIVTAGFNPVMLKAFLFSRIKLKKHIIYTDSWLLTINSLSQLHKLIRKIVFRQSDAFICISEKGRQYLLHYNCPFERIFISPITIDISVYDPAPINEREFDLMFCGQFIDRKMPFFFCQIVISLQKQMPKLKVLLIGDGSLESDAIKMLKNNNIEYLYTGFIQQKDLPGFFQSAKLLLFPTREDHWGVITNEACAAGTPVVTCENAGAAGELIIDEYNGYVLPIDINVWCEKIYNLLSNYQLLKRFSTNAIKQTDKFNVNDSVRAFLKAIGR